MAEESPADRPVAREMLKRIVVAWDSDESLEFLAAVTVARRALGLKLADAEKEADDLEILKANGYEAELATLRTQIQQWQPIETAPRLERILLFYPPQRGLAARIHICDEWDEVGPSRWYFVPTHWMPLPDPPSDAAPRETERE